MVGGVDFDSAALEGKRANVDEYFAVTVVGDKEE